MSRQILVTRGNNIKWRVSTNDFTYSRFKIIPLFVYQSNRKIF